jgi:PadR family transcriptional regulator, regulatory protein PadR
VKKMLVPIPILQGTLDRMILRTLAGLGPRHAYAIATRLEHVSDELIKINQGTLYPAVVRLEQNGWIKGTWGKTESNREAKYYAVRKAGLKATEGETQRWRQTAGVTDKLLTEEA